MTLTTSGVTVSALANELDRATATSKAEVGSATGVGASVALQVIHDNVVRAEVQDSAVLTGGSSLTVDAFGFREVLTKAEGGTAGGTAITPVVALLVSVNDHVTARLGTSTSGYVGTGDVTVRATHQNHIVTEGSAEAAGKSTSVGIDIAINAVVGWDTLAEIARDVSGTAVSVLAVSEIKSEAKSVASATGSDDSGASGDQKANGEVNGSNNPNTQGTKTDTAGMPSSNGGTSGSNGATGANSQQSGQSGSQGSTTGVAAAIAVNWVVATSTARITANRTVTATTGAVTVRSTLLAGANAFGMGSAIDLKKDGTRVGATIGLNVQDLTNQASIGNDAHVTGQTGITVEATVPDPAQDFNDFIVWSFAAAGGKSTSVAGTAAVQILLLTTKAWVGAGAELDAPAGGITVGAYNPLRLQNLAISGALSTNSGTAVGAAFVVNWLEIETKAWIDSSTTVGDVTRADAAGAITVTAKSSLDPLVPDVPEPVKGKVDWLKLTSVAIAGGASSGGAAVTGAFVVDIFSFDTQAWIANGAQLNQEGTVGGVGQTVTVRAEDAIRVVNVGGALALSQSSASVGLTAVIDIVNSNVRAWIGDSADVRAGGSVTVQATANEDWFVIAVAGGGSASSAAVTGSVLVFVFNQGGSSPKVLARIGASDVHALGAVSVLASRTASGPLSAGNLAIGGGSAGIGASAVIVVRSSIVEAGVASGSDIQAGGAGLTVSAVQSGDWKFIAVAGAGGNSAGVAGSVVVDVLNDTTKAHIDGGATVSLPTTNVAVLAQDTTTVLSLAGVIAVGGTAGVGAGVDVEVITKDTEAWIGAGAGISETGNLTVDAKSKETVTSISVGGGFGGTAAVNVNAAVSALNITTKAFLADAASAGTAVVVNVDGSVRVAADENLTLNVIGGNISIGGTAGVGASVAVPVTTKDTHAWIGNFARVNAKGLTPITVATGSYSVTTKDMRFAPSDVNTTTNTITLVGHGFANGDQVQYDAGCDVDGSPSCVAGGLTHRGIYYIVGATANTFQVSLTRGGAPVDITDQGSTENQRFFSTDEANVPVDTTQRFNPQTAVSGNQITTPYSVGAADDDAVVYSSGGGAPIAGLIDGGTYYYKTISGNTFQLLNKKSTDGGTPIAISLTGTTGRGHSITKSGTAPAGDPSAMGPRTILSSSDPNFRGVAVTANNSDNIGAFGVGVSIGGTVGVSLAGAIAVNTIRTSAHIGANAQVNCGASCATNTSGAHLGQSVQVSAANQYYELGIAASLAIGGTAGIAVPVAVRAVGIDTYSYIGTGSAVNARNDIAVTANGKDTIVSVAVGAGGGTVGIAGTVAVTVLNVHTFACTGTPTGTDAYECLGTGPTLRAGDNVLVSAVDDTRMVLITVAIAGGYVGVGAAVGVAVMNKKVEAYLGGSGAVTALAQGSAIGGISDGTVNAGGFGRKNFSGVIVRADSSEDIFGLVPAVAGGFVGVAGGVSVTLLTVLVKAFIGGGGTVDSSGGVNVSATDRFKSLTIAGGIAGGFVGVAGGVDIGVANNSVQAVLGAGLTLTASGDVEVYAVSKKDISTFAVSFAGGFVGVAAAVSVWSIGTTPNGGYQAASGGDDRGTWSATTTYRQGDVVTDSNDGKRYSAKEDSVVGGASPMNNPAKWLGETSALGRGDYDPSQYYNKGDEVRDLFDNKYYTARTDGITGIAPHTDATKWKEGGALNSVNQGGEAAQGGGDGYKDNTLNGTTAAAAPGWVATTSYSTGNRVAFNGKSYSAFVDLAGNAANGNPEVDTTRWKLNSGSEGKTNDRLSTQLGSVGLTISGAAPTTNPGSDALGATPTGGTTATVNAIVIAGGHVHVYAVDRLLVLGVAGAGAVGAVGVGMSVLVLNIKSNTDAGIGSSAQITAGAGSGDNVTVKATMDEDSVGFGFSGAVGAVGIAGQVVVINDTGTQRAHIDGGAQIKRAGGGVLIASEADRHLENYSIGVAVGAIGAGVSVSVVNVSGNNIAETGTVIVGASGNVQSFTATTKDDIDVTGLGVSVAGGAGAIGGVVTFVSLDGTARASASPSGTVGSGGVGAVATGVRSVRVNTLNVTVGGLAVGLTVARANSARHLESVIGGNTITSGPVSSTATATNSAVVRAPGVAIGGVAIGITVVFAVLAGHTSARMMGTVSGSSSINVIATASNLADAKTELFSGSLLGLSGAWASAKVTGDAYIRAIAEAGSSLGSTGAITIKAQTQGDGNHAKGIIDSASFAGLADLKAFVAIGQVLGETRATLDGIVTAATNVTVRADAHNTAETDIMTASVALASLAIGSSDSRVSAGTIASGSGSIAVAGADISFTAVSVNLSTAKSNVMTGGLLLGVAVSAPTADVSAPTRAQWDGTVTAGRNMTIEADATNTVKATLKVLATGLGSVTGGAADAKITNTTVTSAIVGSSAKISGLSQKLLVYAHALNRATAVAGGKGFGAVSISVIYPSAVDQAITKAEVDGDVGTTHTDPAVGVVGDAGALTIEVKAIGDDATNSSVDSLSIGLVAVSTSTAEARTESQVLATLGGGKVTATQDVIVVAQALTDADSYANAASGGLIDIQAGFTARSVDKPIVAATITGGFVQAGGLLSLRALHGAALAPLSDGTVQAINCNGADTICFALPHGINTGSTVTYSAPASDDADVQDGTIPNPNAIGGLGDGRTYGVIKVDDNTLRLGVQFSGTSSVAVATASLFFPGGHNFVTGDRVVYNCNGGGALGTLPVSGLTCGNTYYVYAVDEFNLRLSTTALSQNGNTVVSLVDPDLSGGSTFTVGSTAGLDGQAVVYHAPATIDFKSSLVDVHTDGSGELDQSSGIISHDGSWNTIYALSHGAIDNSEWIYTVTGGPAIGGLFNGQRVWIVLEDLDGVGPMFAAGNHMIRLANTACHAGIGTFDADPGAGVDLHPCTEAMQIIALVPNTTPTGLKASHSLRRVGYESIGLVEGNMYFISVTSGTTFQLKDAAGTVQTGLVDKLGTHRLVNEGIAVVSSGTGNQQLYIDLAGGSLVGSPHVLIGVGGPGALLADSAGSTNGVVSATSTGIGGGLFRFSDVYSEVDVRPTVSAEVLGGILRGGSVKVNGTSYANAAVSSVGKGGGFLGFGASNANAEVVNTVTVTVADGASIFSSSDAEITAVGFITANGEAVNRTGGLIAGADTDVDLELGFTVSTEVAGDIVANRTVLIDAAAGFDATASASSGSGGLGTNSDANDDSGQGVQVGHDHSAAVTTTVAGTGSILGGNIQLSATVGRQYTVNDANGAIDSTLLEARGIARSISDAYALGADSDAGAYVRLNSTANVTLETNSSVEGADVFIRAAHENLNLQSDANSSCGCGGGDTDARANVTATTTSSVVGADESVVRTAGLHVAAYQYYSKLYVHAHRSGGLFDFGSADADLSYEPARDILWESTVYLLGEPNPILIVDASGRITAKTDNVTVRATQFGTPLGIGDVVSGGTIWVDPILYDEKPEALFEANHQASCTGSCTGLIHGLLGIFYMQETWNSVRILNSSDKAIFLKGTAASPSVSINTLNSNLTTTPEATINVSVDNGPHAPPATQWFWKVEHIFPATDVVIESLRGAATTGYDLTIDGDIVNNIGSLRITNDRGSILRGTDAGSETFYANRVTLDAELGSIGTVAQPITLVLFQITHTGEVGVPATLKLIHLDAEAGVDVFLDVTTIRRDSLVANTAPLNPVVASIKAGHDAVVILRDSSEGIDPGAVGDVNVQTFTPNNLPGGTVLETVPTTCYFRPDGAGCTGGVDAPVIVGGQVVLVAFGTTLSPRKANYTFSDIRAGHNLAIFHPSAATEITVTAYTDVDATWLDDETAGSHGVTDGSGKIDVLTNGSIVVVEQSAAGDLRVGHIHTTGLCSGAAPTACASATIAADVTLRSPRMILDAELDAGVIDTDDDSTCVDAYDLDCAAGTPNGVDVTGRNINLYAGDNLLGQPGSASGVGGIGLPGNFLEIQVNAVGGPLGDLDAYDTAADDDKTAGIYIDQVAGDLQVGIVHTAGDTSLTTGNVSLRSRAGSILDAQNDAAADVIGQTIDIDAHGGSIGTAANDLEIDSLVGSPFSCTNVNCANNPNGTSDAGLATAADDVALEAGTGIYLTETDGYLRLVLAHALTGDIRITVRETGAIDEDLFLIRNGTANFAEDDTTAPTNDADHPRVIPNGTVLAETGSVELRVGDDVTLHQNSQILADLSIDIRGDFGNADTGGTIAAPADEYGTSMILRGRIIADCVMTPGGPGDEPMGLCAPTTANPVAGRQTNVWGGSDVDLIQLGDPSGLDLAQTTNAALNKEQLGDAGYIFLGSKTTIHGNATTNPLTSDGEDRITIWYLQSMDVVTSPTGLQSGVGAGRTLNLDGQGESDYYAVYTNGSHGNIRNYVINVLDTGAPNAGVDELAIYGYDNTAAAYNGYLPGTTTNAATDDIFLLRALKCIDNESPFALGGGVPSGCLTPTEAADRPAFVALLAGSAAADGGIGSYRDRTAGNEPSTLVQRINYDTALNGRITVFGEAGNDAFFVDDTTATITLDGGAGNDSFQIGQIFGTQRDGESAPDGGALLPADTFPSLVPTTRGWLSPGAHAPLLATGGTGNDRFTVYSNQAEIQLNGDDNNDLFVVRAFAIAAVCDTNADNIAGCGLSDVNFAADPITGAFPVPNVPGGQCTLANGYIRYDNNGDNVCNNADAHMTFNHLTGSNADLDNTMWEDDIIPIDANGVAVPVIGLGFSTARPLDIRAGGGEDEVQYNVNAPVNVDGGTGFDKLVVLGTEFADDFAITDKGIFGGGLNVKYTTVEVVEVDGLEGDDQFFVQSTAYGVAYRVIGGLGSDLISVAGDVTSDIVTRELEGLSGAVDHIVTAPNDPGYDGLPTDGVPYNLATQDQGIVVIRESTGGTVVREGAAGTAVIKSYAHYTVELAVKPTANVYVTVSAAWSPSQEAAGDDLNPAPLSDGIGDTVWLCVGTADSQCDEASEFQRHKVVNGVVVDEAGRAVVLTFTTVGDNWKTPQRVYLWAVDDPRAEGDRFVVVQHSVISGDARFDGAAVRQVNALVYDNDTPGVYAVPVTPGGSELDGRTLVIEGSSATERTDDILLSLAKAPTAGDTIWVKIWMDADSQRLITLDFSAVPALRWQQFSDGAGGTYYAVKFDSMNWDVPLRIVVHARNNSDPGDPLTAVVNYELDTALTAPAAASAYPFPNLRSGLQRTDVLVYDDETPNVVSIPTGTDTVVIKCGDEACTIPGGTDGYTIRLTRAPNGTVTVSLLTDGLVDVVSVGGVAVTPADYRIVGGDIPSRLFLGNLSFAGNTVTRANGSDLGNFTDEGFAAGQRITMSTCGATIFTIVSVGADGKTLVLNSPVAGCGSGTGASINLLTRSGIWSGSATTELVGGAWRLVRPASGSWLADGFLEGQWVEICQGATCIRAKIAVIRGGNAGHDEKLELRPVGLSGDSLAAFLSGGQFSVVRIAAAVTFVAAGNDYATEKYIELEADVAYSQPLQRQGVKIFPASTHLLSKLRGPLAVEGGVSGADRSLELGLKLPGEQDGPLFAIGAQAPETKQIDVLNIYNDSSQANGRGVMNSTTLTGFGMAKDLDFGASYGGAGGQTFGEPQVFPGGISYGTVQFVDGQFVTNGAKSTIEVFNLLLGVGNDRLDIQGTLQPDDAVKLTGTVVLAVSAGQFGSTHRLSRPAPFDWKAQGFIVGMPVTISGMTATWKVVGFGDDDPSDTTDNTVMYLKLLSGAAAPGTMLRTVIGADVPVTVTAPVVITPNIQGDGGTVTRSSGSWANDGFAVGQLVMIQGLTGQWRLMEISTDGKTLTLRRGDVIAAPSTGTRTVFVPGPHGGITAVHGGGNSPIQNSFDMVRSLPAAGAPAGTALVLTRLDGLPWGLTPFLAGSGYVVGNPYGNGPQHVQLAGESFTRMILGVGTAACPFDDPFPHCGEGSVLYLSGPVYAGPLGTVATSVHVASPVEITVTAPIQVHTDYIVRTDGGSFLAAGFSVGIQVRISGMPGPYTIKALTASTMTFWNVAFQPTVSLNAAGVAVWSAPIFTITGYDPTRDGGVRIGGDVITICNLVNPIDGVTCDVDATAGPGSPLVVYGDTSQDGVWYSGHPSDVLGMEFGPKPFDPFTNIPDAENEDDEWMLGLADPYDFAGNDIIDASGLFANRAANNLPTVGFTAYGGLGDDLIIGSQAGDHLAGGSGNDEIRGLRGVDHIYGDSGINVNLFTRALDIAVTDRSPKPSVTGAGYLNNGTTIQPYPSPVRDDLLVAGRDLLFGEGAGTMVGGPESVYDDVIFGDHGAIVQDVADPNLPDPRLQKIQTTAISTLLSIESRNIQRGSDDVIFGNLGRDVLVGGAGHDMVDGDEADDILFGDNVTFVRIPGNWTSPHFQTLCGTLLYSRTDQPNACGGLVGEDNSGLLLVDGTPRAYRDPDGAPWWAEYDVTNLFHSFAFDEGTAGAGSFGNDYLAGSQANDVILGQLGNDTIQGDGGSESAFARMTDDPTHTWHVGASRTPLGCLGAPGSMVCDYTGVLVVVSSFEAATDGEDYLEGNAGNDRIFGGLGQDDIVGGSSDFFSLVSPDLRPDGVPTPASWYAPGDDRGADVLFGGAGTQIGVNNQTSGTASVPGLDGGILGDGTLAANMHARDADTIVADNGRIIRIVGVNGIDVNPSGAAGQANYTTFNYDTYGSQRLVVRGVHLLDYTVGGPDFAPENFGLPVGSDCNGSLTQPTCSAILDTATGTWKYLQIGGRDEVHGETGDDTVYTGADHDAIYGDAQDDDLIGGWGNDWISGGTGSDGILGDDGRIFTSRNTGCSVNSSAVCTQFAEPLYGILKFRTVDPDTRTSQGDVLNEFIYTPGQVQTATINVAGQLVKAADLTVYNLGPNENMSQHHVANQPTFDANNSDDIIFGGWGGDWIHGGAGDDAISGAEALTSGYAQHFDSAGNPVGLEYIDFAHPWNPGDVLHFGADTNAWHSNNHNALRLGEFLLYDEYDPRRVILFNGDGTLWKGGVAPWSRPFFLNNDATSGNWVTTCVAVDNKGACISTISNQPSDGNDVIFGDLGNDWSVGGTGEDTIWVGWGNDLSNADDLLTTKGGLNDAPDGVNSSYQDRVYGGAGLDILIGNTGGDRLIDWVGEFNSYLVPFAPFGIATVSRQVNPQLPEFLYALSKSQGADPTRATDTGEDPARNGEPFGELGLITQHDHNYWQTQTGGPTDPQAGNIPGGRRDTIRGADFNDGTLQGFATDSGAFAVQSGTLRVTATSSANDAVAVFYSDTYTTVYYELSASIAMDKPTSGWKANAFVIFDYFGEFDFKFAGVDQSTNKMVIGHRDANGWWYDAQGSVPGGVKSGKTYDLNVIVNGLVVTVTIDGKNAFSYQFSPRILDGESIALNRGMFGFGSNQAHGWFDNIDVTVISPEITLDRTEKFDAPTAAFTPVTGSWTTGAGRYAGVPGTGAPAIALVGYAADGTGSANDARLDPLSYLEVEAVLAANGFSGIVFDYYDTDDFKFVALDVAGSRLVIGHFTSRGGWVVDRSITKVLVAGRDYRLNLVLKATVVTITLDGQVITSYMFNSPLADGQTGVFGRTTTQSVDSFRLRTDDTAYVGVPLQGAATGRTALTEEAPTPAATTTDAVMLAPAAASTATSPFSANVSPDGGWSFAATGANNRDYYQVRVVCTVGGAVVYSTTLVLVIGADGTGTTQVIHPPPGDCVATLEFPKGNDRVRVLDTVQFTAV